MILFDSVAQMIVWLVVLHMGMAFGWWLRGKRSIDYKRRWQEALEIVKRERSLPEGGACTWKVEVENDGYGGRALVYVVGGDQHIKVASVGYDRRSSMNPKMTFDESLALSLDQAEAAAEDMNVRNVMPR